MTDVLRSARSSAARCLPNRWTSAPAPPARTGLILFEPRTADITGDWQGLPTRTDLDLLDLQPGSTVR